MAAIYLPDGVSVSDNSQYSGKNLDSLQKVLYGLFLQQKNYGITKEKISLIAPVSGDFFPSDAELQSWNPDLSCPLVRTESASVWRLSPPKLRATAPSVRLNPACDTQLDWDLTMFIHCELVMLILALTLDGQVHTGEIIQGHEAVPHSRPYMVLVEKHMPNRTIKRCGGFILNEDFVMTAAHCQASTYTVLLGVHDATSKNILRVPVEQAFPHKDYDEKTLKNDIMLLKGDSGGPLICEDEKAYGVISYMHKSHSGGPHIYVYAKIPDGKKWIDSTIKNA
ncbi:hypothetical protein L3Q82_008015 [Scortum barcoo]|uniref:Uncharacterized protein n=1 Tax=Scortum barcoo TaxID=214431 RepID=A0ACB8WNN6_9TELE|nr:hypothetical protein L3Q82_008015 [Scortum barcoo]